MDFISLEFRSRLLDDHTSGKMNSEPSHAKMLLKLAYLALLKFHRVIEKHM